MGASVLAEVPLSVLITKFLIGGVCLACGIHLLATSSRVFATVSFCIMFAAGFSESVIGGTIFVLEDQQPRLYASSSLPSLVTYLSIMISCFGGIMLAVAMCEYLTHHWMGKVARKHRTALCLLGACVTSLLLAIIVYKAQNGDAFGLTMFLSIPPGLVLVSALILVWRHSWARASPLAWIHRPTMWVLSGMFISLIGCAETVVTLSGCGESGGVFPLVACPFLTGLFDPQVVYQVLRIAGYALTWVGARRMCKEHRARFGNLPAGTGRRRSSHDSDESRPLLHGAGGASGAPARSRTDSQLSAGAPAVASLPGGADPMLPARVSGSLAAESEGAGVGGGLATATDLEAGSGTSAVVTSSDPRSSGLAIRVAGPAASSLASTSGVDGTGVSGAVAAGATAATGPVLARSPVGRHSIGSGQILRTTSGHAMTPIPQGPFNTNFPFC